MMIDTDDVQSAEIFNMKTFLVAYNLIRTDQLNYSDYAIKKVITTARFISYGKKGMQLTHAKS